MSSRYFVFVDATWTGICSRFCSLRTFLSNKFRHINAVQHVDITGPLFCVNADSRDSECVSGVLDASTKSMLSCVRGVIPVG